MKSASIGPPAHEWAEFPYPGERPAGSWAMDAQGFVWPVSSDGGTDSGWAVLTHEGPVCLDEWLGRHDADPVASRTGVLSYGSNGNPVKARQVVGPVVNLACVVTGLSAVWCNGVRRAGDVPCTLAPMTGVVETHVVTLCTSDQLAVLDRVEGHPTLYERRTLPDRQVILEDGTRPTVQTYVGVASERLPILVDGQPLRVSMVDQSSAAEALRHATAG